MEGVVIVMLLFIATILTIRKCRRANKISLKTVTINDNTIPMNINDCYATAETYKPYVAS